MHRNLNGFTLLVVTLVIWVAILGLVTYIAFHNGTLLPPALTKVP